MLGENLSPRDVGVDNGNYMWQDNMYTPIMKITLTLLFSNIFLMFFIVLKSQLNITVW